MELQEFNFNQQGELIIPPSPTSSKHDFDFFFGKWELRNRKLTERLKNSDDWEEFSSTQECYAILHGLGNIDNFLMPQSDFEGMTVRLFNPATKLWSIYWADSERAVLDKPVVGSFSGQVGHFYSRGEYAGSDVLWRFKWDARDKENPVWSQAISTDMGKSWEWNWYMYMHKIG